MKARLIQAIFLTLPTVANAQGLTNGQVYDFAIGDVFQTKDYWCVGGCFSCPPMLYVQDSIIDKQFGVGGYDVLYTIHQQRYRAPGGPFPAEDTTLVVDFGIADTAAYPEHWCATCPGDCDGFYLASDTLLQLASACGRTAWVEYRFPCDTCECDDPPYTWSSKFIEGCGGPYHDMGAIDPNYVCSGVALTYYNKGGIECGNAIAMGLGATVMRPSFAVFPDPVEDILYWSDHGRAAYVEIRSMSGAMVLRDQASGQVDVSMLRPGLYVLSRTDPEGRTERARFVKR